jgi:hypothetical protein
MRALMAPSQTDVDFSITKTARSIEKAGRTSGPVREFSRPIDESKESNMNARSFFARLAGAATFVAALSVSAFADEGDKQATAVVGISGMT